MQRRIRTVHVNTNKTKLNSADSSVLYCTDDSGSTPVTPVAFPRNYSAELYC